MNGNQMTKTPSEVWYDHRQSGDRFFVGILTLFSRSFYSFDYFWSRMPNSEPASYAQAAPASGIYPSDDEMLFYGAIWDI